MKISVILGIAFVSLALAGCGTTAKTTVNKVDGSLNQETVVQDYQGLKRVVAIARFSNETEYAKGAFYDKENDPVGKQAVFSLLSRSLQIACLFESCYSFFNQQICQACKIKAEGSAHFREHAYLGKARHSVDFVQVKLICVFINKKVYAAQACKV